MTAIKELLSALSRPRPTDIEEDHQQAVVPARHTIRLGPILARLRQSDNCEGNFNHCVLIIVECCLIRFLLSRLLCFFLFNCQ